MSRPMPKQQLRLLLVALSLAVLLGFFFVLFDKPDFAPSSTVRLMGGWYTDEGVCTLPQTDAKHVGDAHTIYAALPILNQSDRLIFRSENLNIRVALDDKTIYQTLLAHRHETVGDKWHTVYIPDTMQGHIISITSTILFANGSNFITAVYIGSRADFIRQYIANMMPGYVVSVLVGLLGVAYLFSGRLMARPLNVHVPLSFAGVCLAGGLWCAMQTHVPELLYGQTALQINLTYATLPLAVGMMCFYLRTLPAPRWLANTYLVAGVVLLLAFAAVLLCEMLHWAAFVESMPYVRVAMLAVMGLFTLQLPSLLRRYRANFYLLLGLLCPALTVGMDLAHANRGTYDYAHATRFGLLWMVLLVTVQYGVRLRKSLRLADQAEVMRSLAYRDPLTGLYNRLALVSDQEALLANPLGCVGIVQMDINNLKPINDEYGHEAGDALILRASRAIQAAFGSQGKCYRVGGDEFVALITHNVCEATYHSCESRLAEACDKENAGQAQLLSIAIGFALFQPANGDRFYDLVRIADMRMYAHKRRMKNGEPRDMLAGETLADTQPVPDSTTVDAAAVQAGQPPRKRRRYSAPKQARGDNRTVR